MSHLVSNSASPSATEVAQIPTGLEFPEPMTLQSLQTHSIAVCRHFGWDQITDEKNFILFVEEVGELAKAMRKAIGLMVEQNNPDKPVHNQDKIKQSLQEEFADVLNNFLELANRFDIDLEDAYRTKMTANFKRQWA